MNTDLNSITHNYNYNTFNCPIDENSPRIKFDKWIDLITTNLIQILFPQHVKFVNSWRKKTDKLSLVDDRINDSGFI